MRVVADGTLRKRSPIIFKAQHLVARLGTGWAYRGNMGRWWSPPRVYFLRCGDFVKIGYSSNLDKRVSAIQVGAPLPLAKLGVIRADTPMEARQLEELWHWRFGALHVHGEWFRAEGELLDVISKEVAPWPSKP